MVVQSGSGDSRKAHTGAYKDKSKPAEIRSSNINAAKGKFGILHCVEDVNHF
jgi:T-complex protein 1 subunit delta